MNLYISISFYLQYKIDGYVLNFCIKVKNIKLKFRKQKCICNVYYLLVCICRFGAMFLSETTGIILNNHMNDFSLPDQANKYGLYPSPTNFIQPKKMPLSSFCPTVVIDKNDNVRMLAGAAGGAKIISSTSAVINSQLYFLIFPYEIKC